MEGRGNQATWGSGVVSPQRALGMICKYIYRSCTENGAITSLTPVSIDLQMPSPDPWDHGIRRPESTGSREPPDIAECGWQKCY